MSLSNRALEHLLEGGEGTDSESEAVDVVVDGLFGALGDGGGGDGRGMRFQDAEETQDGGAAVGFEGVGGNLAKEVGGRLNSGELHHSGLVVCHVFETIGR